MLTFGCHYYSFYFYLVQFSSLLLLYCSSLFFRLKDIATLDQPQALHCRFLVPGNTQKILTEIWHHFWLKMMVKSGLEKKYFEIQRWPSELPAKLPGQFSLSRQLFLHWAAATLKGLVEFQNKKTRPLFTIIFNSKMLVSRSEILVYLF